jgi:hypothetical protein
LETGKLNVYRHDREELLEIKNGKYKLNELALLGEKNGKQTVVDGLLAEEFFKFDEAFKNSNLTNEPNFAIIEEFLISLHKELLNNV